MTIYYEKSGISLHKGNALDVLKGLPDGSARCCVTSPPYWGLRDYGEPGQLGLEPTPEEYVAKMVEIFREVRRVLAVDGTLWLNLGDSYNGSQQKGGKGYISGSGKSNPWIENSKPRNVANLKPKDLVGIPWRVAFALQADGWYLRSDIIWAKPNPMPESVTDRPTKAHEYIFLMSKSERYYYDGDAVREPQSISSIERWNGNNYRRNPQVSKKTGHLQTNKEQSLGCNPLGRNKRSVWTVSTQPFPGAHFAVFPPSLIKPCILAGSAPDDVVLDPFVGSGTTAYAAKELNRGAIGIDLSAKYLDMAVKRLRQEVLPLMVSHAP